MPFGEYKDFDDCVAKNRDKRDPQAYCGYIKHQIEGTGKSDEGVGLHDYPTVGALLKGKVCKTCSGASLLQAHKCSAPDTCLCLACLVDAGVDPEAIARALSASVPSVTVTPNAPLYEDEALPYKCDYCSLRFPSYEKRAQHVGTDHPEMIKRDEENEAIEDVAGKFYEASASLLSMLRDGLSAAVTKEVDRFNPATLVSPTEPPFTKQLLNAPGVEPVPTPYQKVEAFGVEVGWFAKTLDQVNEIVDNFEAYMDEFHYRDEYEVEEYKAHNKKLGNDWMEPDKAKRSSKRYWQTTKPIMQAK